MALALRGSKCAAFGDWRSTSRGIGIRPAVLRFVAGTCGWSPRTISRRCRISALLPACTQQVSAKLFTLATTLVIPVYMVMVIAPRKAWAKRLIENSSIYIVLGAIYTYLLIGSWTPETPRLIFATKHYLPELSGICRMFRSTTTVASAWVHLLVVDLFAARQIFLDGLENDIETRHSLMLCLMACPIGMLCHEFTKNLSMLSRQRSTKLDQNCTTELNKI